MSFRLLLDELDDDTKQQIVKNLTIKTKKDIYNDRQRSIRFFAVQNNPLGNYVFIPIGVWKEYRHSLQVSKEKNGKSFFPNGDITDFPRANLKFKTVLYTSETDPVPGRSRDQQTVAKEIIKQLKKNGHSFASLPTGFGKTILAAYAACKVCKNGLKTIVLSHNDSIKEQFYETFTKFTTAKVQILTGKKPLDEDADVYIIGVLKCGKSKRELFENIGFVIIDESHLVTEAAFTKALLKFEPRFLLGLSATPDRNDGLDKAFKFYFGTPDKYITRFETKDFIAIRYGTRIKPDIEYTVVKGHTIPNWAHIIGSIEESPHVHRLIVDIILKHPEEKIMVLSSRTAQTEGIYSLLIDANESVETYIGTKKKKNCDLSKRILLSTNSKGGVGFDDPSRTMLIIACDTKDPRQYEGRIRTANNIVYTIVHNYSAFHKHYEKCEEWFVKRGAEIRYEGYIPEKKQKIKVNTGPRFLNRNKKK